MNYFLRDMFNDEYISQVTREGRFGIRRRKKMMMPVCMKARFILL